MIEINTLLNILAQVPTGSNVWPLFIKIKQQAEQANEQL